MAAVVLFFLVILTAPIMQPVLASCYIIVSFSFILFLQHRTDTEQNPLIRQRRDFLPFIKEIEPSIFIYGIAFGLGFAALFIEGGQALLWGMLSVLVGAGAIFLLDSLGINVNITIVQRALTVVMVAACLVIPFASDVFGNLGPCLLVASWGAFCSVNWAILVRKCVEQKLQVFYSIASGISVSSLGFLAGWLLSLAFAYTGFQKVILTAAMLALAFSLVFVIMLFLPDSSHHDSEAAAQPHRAPIKVPPGEVNEKALFWMRVDAVSQLYGLSPRERDVLGYLVKGRNASYIQKELVVSPHTAKSHIYNIYRKLDIHSQQKLMDFVEDFPVEMTKEKGN